MSGSVPRARARSAAAAVGRSGGGWADSRATSAHRPHGGKRREEADPDSLGSDIKYDAECNHA